MHAAAISFAELQVRLLFEGGYNLGCSFYSNKYSLYINIKIQLHYVYKRKCEFSKYKIMRLTFKSIYLVSKSDPMGPWKFELSILCTNKRSAISA